MSQYNCCMEVKGVWCVCERERESGGMMVRRFMYMYTCEY